MTLLKIVVLSHWKYKEFNPAVAQIVVGLTKISKIKFKTKEESQAENFRKMVVAMAKDIRVIIVKLADRMHNMNFIFQKKNNIKLPKKLWTFMYPLASRLGINSVKAELEDLFVHKKICITNLPEN